MNYSVTEASLESLVKYRTDPGLNLDWNSVFITPEWLQVWWKVFGEGQQSFIRVISDADRVIGIAPLRLEKDTAMFIGDTDVCDYQDFIIETGSENAFSETLLDDLKAGGVKLLDLKHVRPDSTIYKHFREVAGKRNFNVECIQEDISVEMALPATWDDYLASLNSKQRHEVRRKLRRLSEAGNIEYIFTDNTESVPGFMDTFFRMFTESRQDKAAFLTGQMETFFRSMVEKMAAAGVLKLGALRLDGRDMASIICFDYNDTIYLYNSGYDPEFNYLSVGLLSKVLCIRDSIESRKKTFDFLKGNEPYKFHLGGREVPLYRCRISLG
jgi:CelD/BcsL family acetyltransferase involved in cellulose biosynthesis